MYLRAHPALEKRSILFLPLSDRATARWCDAAGTPRDHPSQGHGSSPAAFHQMPRCTADERASIVPGHLSSPFRQSFDAELLAVPAPERGLAAGASSSSTLGTGCSSWSTGCFHWFLFLLVGVLLNRRLHIAGIVRCVGGSHRCTPLVAVTVWVFSSLAAVGEPSCHLPSASVDRSLPCRGSPDMQARCSFQRAARSSGRWSHRRASREVK